MVRIVDDFWENYSTYEEIITKSTLHLLRTKFPNNGPQGETEDVNLVILELHRLHIFEKWNQNRIKTTKTTLAKQFENFIYQRIHSILWNEYGRRKKRSVRFKRVDTDNICKDTWKADPSLFREDVPLDENIEEKELQHKRVAKIVHLKDLHDYVSLQEDTDYEAEHNSAYNAILKACKSERDKQIIKYKLEGLSHKDIEATLNITGGVISDTLKRVQNKYMATR